VRRGTAVSDPLSIAMLSHLASPAAPTGAEHSLALLAGELHARGHRVRVFAPGPSSLAAVLAERGVETERIRCRSCWTTYPDARPWPEALLRWTRFVWPDPGAIGLTRALRSGGFDVAHVNCLPHLRGAAAGNRAGLPVVWHLREVLPAGARRRWWAGRLRRHATRLVAVSRAVGSWVDDEGLSERLVVVHNGTRIPARPPAASAARDALGLPGDRVIVGLFGQVRLHKGPFEFVRAAGLAAGKDPRLLFVVAGAGPPGLLERLREAVGKLGDDRVRLLPAQESAERLYAAADVVCLTTTTPDPLPRSVLEAMAAGVPVVAFRSGGTAEMVEDGVTGWLVDVGDVEGLADACLRLAADVALRERMGARGRECAASSFSLARHVDRMEAVLREAAAR